MSGRDVRRLAGRASTMTHEAKRDIVARIATGADAMGVTDIYVTREPFRIASAALEQIPLKARVHVIEHELANDAGDTQRSMAAYLEAGARSFVSLGGDGTNRALVREMLKAQQTERHPDLDNLVLVPLSTGTNNVFPILAEPTIAGMVAGLYSNQRVPLTFAPRAKVLHLELDDGVQDIALIDIVHLKDDHVGNLLPFAAEKLTQMVLARAEADAVGMSPIGGYLEVVDAAADHGLWVQMGGGRRLNAPLSPGLFAEVFVSDHTRLGFDESVEFSAPGVLALDGDRDHKLVAGASARVVVRRDGPLVPDLADVMRFAADTGIMAAATTETTSNPDLSEG